METVLDIERPLIHRDTYLKSIGYSILPLSNANTNWYDYIRINSMELTNPQPRIRFLQEIEDMIRFAQTDADKRKKKLQLLSLLLIQTVPLPTVSSFYEIDYTNLKSYQFGQILRNPILKDLAVTFFSQIPSDQLEWRTHWRMMYAMLLNKKIRGIQHSVESVPNKIKQIVENIEPADRPFLEEIAQNIEPTDIPFVDENISPVDRPFVEEIADKPDLQPETVLSAINLVDKEIIEQVVDTMGFIIDSTIDTREQIVEAEAKGRNIVHNALRFNILYPEETTSVAQKYTNEQQRQIDEIKKSRRESTGLAKLYYNLILGWTLNNYWVMNLAKEASQRDKEKEKQKK